MSNENTLKFGNIEATHDGSNNNIVAVVRDLTLAFTHHGKDLFVPSVFKGTEQWSGMLIAQKEDTQDDLDEVVAFMMKEHLKDKNIEDKNNCLKDGDTQTSKDGEIYEGFGGNLAIKFKNKVANHEAPQVFSMAQERIEEFPDKRILKDGAIVDAQLRFYAYTGENNGISCELQVLAFVDEGTPFSGGPSKADPTALLAGREPKGDDDAPTFARKKRSNRK